MPGLLRATEPLVASPFIGSFAGKTRRRWLALAPFAANCAACPEESDSASSRAIFPRCRSLLRRTCIPSFRSWPPPKPRSMWPSALSRPCSTPIFHPENMQLTANEPFFVPTDKRELAERVFRALAIARFTRRSSLLAYAGPLGLEIELLDAWVASGLLHQDMVQLDAIAGAEEPYLALTRQGARMLSGTTGLSVDAVSPSQLKRFSQKRAHDVVVGDVALAVLALRRDQGIDLLGLETDPRRLGMLRATVAHGRDAEQIHLVPDAYVLTRGSSGPVALLVEVDRGTVSVARMRKKYEGYLAWKREGGPLRDLGVNAVRIVTTAPSQSRFNRLVGAALGASDGRKSGLLLFAAEEDLSAATPERMREPIALPLGAAAGGHVPLFDNPGPTPTSRVVLPTPGPIRQVVRPLAIAAPQ